MFNNARTNKKENGKAIPDVIDGHEVLRLQQTSFSINIIDGTAYRAVTNSTMKSRTDCRTQPSTLRRENLDHIS